MSVTDGDFPHYAIDRRNAKGENDADCVCCRSNDAEAGEGTNAKITPMKRCASAVILTCLIVAAVVRSGAQPAESLRVGFGECDITPDPTAKLVWVAGFGKNRKATKIHDRLFTRAAVFVHDNKKIAIVSVDVVGLFNDVAERVRKKLPGFSYVLVCSTHNHEGPDTMGLWGPNLWTSGIDADYMKQLEAGIVKAVEQADQAKAPARADIGTAKAPELLHDAREPIVKHDELAALRIKDANGKTAGIIVQWNCHPETLSSKNTEISADFVGATVKYLKKKHACPVVYLTGTVGGLMTSLHVEIKDDAGTPLADGTFEKTERYGQLIGQLADKALAAARPIELDPARSPIAGLLSADRQHFLRARLQSRRPQTGRLCVERRSAQGRSDRRQGGEGRRQAAVVHQVGGRLSQARRSGNRGDSGGNLSGAGAEQGARSARQGGRLPRRSDRAGHLRPD